MIKILFLAANPKDTGPLRLGEAVRGIKERLRLAKLRDEFVVADQTISYSPFFFRFTCCPRRVLRVVAPSIDPRGARMISWNSSIT